VRVSYITIGGEWIIMRNDNDSRSDEIGVRRNVIKTTPDRVTALWLSMIFIIGSAAFIGTWIGYFLFGGFCDLAYTFGFGSTVFVCSVVVWFTIIIQENSQDLHVKIVKER
jgi:ABC-type methionine transport system permease subunit